MQVSMGMEVVTVCLRNVLSCGPIRTIAAMHHSHTPPITRPITTHPFISLLQAPFTKRPYTYSSITNPSALRRRRRRRYPRSCYAVLRPFNYNALANSNGRYRLRLGPAYRAPHRSLPQPVASSPRRGRHDPRPPHPRLQRPRLTLSLLRRSLPSPLSKPQS